ncbi:nuclear transport factor 2 family protein [Robertkochia flava]|uniref:nuclear transport factor 2 family protein n=1 Tax=Robertkochia flava TaxID=3447986 RepID=UPI001CCCDD1B|nr:nuclear transport factor 2 family protein [Robertkochia marina]
MRIFYTLLCICLCSLPALGQNTSLQEEEKIEQLINDVFNGIWSDLNPENIQKYQTDDFLLLEHGEVWNNDTIARYMDRASKRSPLPERVNNIKIIEVKVFGDHAWVAYHNRATISAEGKVVRKAYWLESATAIRTEEGWKLDMMHSTRVKNETYN